MMPQAFWSWVAMDGFGVYVWSAYGFVVGGFVGFGYYIWRALQVQLKSDSSPRSPDS